MAAACATGPSTPSSSATGVVIAAEGPNAAQVDGFSLRTSDGQVMVFIVGTLDLTNGGLPAPHIREHRVSGEPITVDYRDENGQKVAIRYRDAHQ